VDAELRLDLFEGAGLGLGIGIRRGHSERSFEMGEMFQPSTASLPYPVARTAIIGWLGAVETETFRIDDAIAPDSLMHPQLMAEGS
jgi:hypothetical protein